MWLIIVAVSDSPLKEIFARREYSPDIVHHDYQKAMRGMLHIPCFKDSMSTAQEALEFRVGDSMFAAIPEQLITLITNWI